MNKKEIAQQYTRQILEQEPGSQQEQQQKEKEQTSKELGQAELILFLLQAQYKQAKDDYRTKTEKQIEATAMKLRELDRIATHLASQIKSIVSQAESISKVNNQVGSRWIIRIYLIAILSGLCSALIIMLIIWTEIR
jgi:hypothetical protein